MKLVITIFNLEDKRVKRDRWVLLRKKFKSKLREEAASGISPDELSENDQLIEELTGTADNEIFCHFTLMQVVFFF